jgi:hypothetical protein
LNAGYGFVGIKLMQFDMKRHSPEIHIEDDDCFQAYICGFAQVEGVKRVPLSKDV